LCPSSVCVVATFPGSFISFTIFSAPVFSLIHWFFSLSSFVIPSFHSRTVHFDIIKVLLPTDAQENCFKRSIKIKLKQLQHVSM
jgi:hypothetical protein